MKIFNKKIHENFEIAESNNDDSDVDPDYCPLDKDSKFIF